MDSSVISYIAFFGRIEHIAIYRFDIDISNRIGRLSIDFVRYIVAPNFLRIDLYCQTLVPVTKNSLTIDRLNSSSMTFRYHVFVSCGGKMFNVSTSVIAAECFKMFGVCDVAEAVVTRRQFH